MKKKEMMQRDKGIDTDEIRFFLDVPEMTEKEWNRFNGMLRQQVKQKENYLK